MGGTRDIEIRCPNCKSFNYAVLLSERVAAFNKVKLRCVDCKHAWEMLIPPGSLSSALSVPRSVPEKGTDGFSVQRAC